MRVRRMKEARLGNRVAHGTLMGKVPSDFWHTLLPSIEMSREARGLIQARGLCRQGHFSLNRRRRIRTGDVQQPLSLVLVTPINPAVPLIPHS